MKIVSLEQQNLKKIGHCHGNLLSGYDQDEKGRNDIAATQKCTRFQSMPGHSKGIGRNLSKRNAALLVPIIRSLEEDNGRIARVWSLSSQQ